VGAEEAKVIKVGVYKGRFGANNIVSALNEAGGFKAERFDKLQNVTDLKTKKTTLLKDTLLKYDLVVIPHSGYNFGAGAVKDRGPQKNRDILGAYVSCGHGLLMCHYGVGGYRCVPEAFPEVGKNFHRMNENIFVVKDKKHPAMQGLPGRFKHAYYDQTLMEVGPRGRVLAENKAGFPTIIAGTLGLGRMVLTGSIVGFSGDPLSVAPFGDEKQFLINAAKWLGSAPKRDPEKFEDWRQLCDERLENWMTWREVEYQIDQLRFNFVTTWDVIGWDMESLVERKKLSRRKYRALQADINATREQFDTRLNEVVEGNRDTKAQLDEMSFGRPSSRTIGTMRITRQRKRDEFMRKVGYIQALKPWLIDPVKEKVDAVKEKAGPPKPNIKAPTWLQDEFFRTIMFTGYWSAKSEYVMKAYKAAGANAIHCYGSTYQPVWDAMKKEGYLLPLIRQTGAGYDYFNLENDLKRRLGEAAQMDDCPSFVGFEMDEPVARVPVNEQSLTFLRGRLKRELTPEQFKTVDEAWEGIEGCYKITDQALANTKKAGASEPLAAKLAGLEGRIFRDTKELDAELLELTSREVLYGHKDLILERATVKVPSGAKSAADALKNLLTPQQLKLLGDKLEGLRAIYLIRESALESMKKGGLPEELATKLAKLKDRPYRARGGKRGFDAAVASVISHAKFQGLRDSILAYAVIHPPGKVTNPAEQILWVEWQECHHESMSKYMQALDTALAKKRPNVGIYPVLQQWLPDLPQRAGLRLNSSVLRGCSTDIYNTGNYETAFQLDLLRADAKGNTGLCAGTCYENSPHSYERDICIPLAHGTGIWVWNWFYQAPYRHPRFWWKWAGWLDYTWRPGMWDATVRTFKKIERIEPYLVKTGSPSRIVLLYSERTGIVDSYLDREKRVYAHEISQYFYNNMGWYHALSQSHVQVDVLYADSLTAERLAPYATAIVVDGRALREKTITILREWVRAGGSLVATPQTSLTDAWGNQRAEKTYALGDLFGVKFVEEKGGAKSLTIDVPDPILGDLKPGSAVTYDAQRTYDKVEPTTGKVTAKFDTGDPALIVKSAGKGRSIFLAARKIGMAYEGAKYAGETKNHFKDYFPGVRELITNVVVQSLKAAGQELPFTATCDKNVEVAARTQQNRLIVHLTNYTYRTPITGAGVQVRVPANEELRVFYPVDGAEVGHTIDEGAVTFTVRDFDVHEAVVVEWK